MTAIFTNHREGTATSGPADAMIAWDQVYAIRPGAAGSDQDADVWFDLGIALSTGSQGLPCDLIEAHKWFNIAASTGHAEGARCRADLARDMTAREVSEAQRRARAWLGEGRRAA